MLTLKERIYKIAPNARDYQVKAIEDIYEAFKRGDKHILLQSPTGTGKTFIFSVLSALINQAGNKVLVLTHRRKLLDQAGKSFKKFGLNPFFIQAGLKYISNKHSFFIGMTKTISNRMNDPDWIEWLKDKTIIIDECHLQHFNWLFESGIIDNNYVTGVTATPRRSGKQRQLGLDYRTIIETISVKRAIQDGHLVNCDLNIVGGVSSKDIKWDSMKGDFQEKSMFDAFNTGKMYSGMIKNYEDICPYTKTIVFCCNIEHVIKTTQELVNKGYKAKYVVSQVNIPKLPLDINNEGKMAEYEERMKVYNLYKDTFNELSGDQDDILEQFDNNEFQFLVNKDILTAGYDCPDIESVVIYRLTQSISLWLQMLGRGSRISEVIWRWITKDRPIKMFGKTHFNVLYFGDNFDDLGAYDEDREWSLWHEEKKGEGLPPMKFCGITAAGRPINKEGEKEGCKRMIHASLKICPTCGFIYPEKEILEAELTGIALDIDSGDFIVHKRVKDMSISELEKHRELKSYKMPWLWKQLYIRGGFDLVESYCKEKKYSKGTIELAKLKCCN